MFSVSVSVVLLVFFVSQAIGQSTTTVNPSPKSSTVPSSSVSNSTTTTATELPTTTSVQPTTTPPKRTIGQSTTTVNPSSASSVVSSSSPTTPTTPTTTTTPTTPTTPTTTTSEQPTTTSEKTCANLSVVIDKPWSNLYENKTSEEFRNVSKAFSSALKTLYSDPDKFTHVAVSEVHFTEKEGKLSASAILCLVFKGDDDDFIEDVFKKQVKKGMLGSELTVKKDSAKFEPLGVSFKDWKAKEGQCENKCDGAAGPFSIVKECEPDKGYSCDGHKEPTDETKDCTKYCDSSTVAATVSSVMIGIILSFSFQ